MKPVTSHITPALETWKATEREISLKVWGGSMAPLIRAGDYISLRLTQSDNLRPGDVVAFLQNEDITVHRLIKKKKVNGQRWFCQKGDNLLGWAWIPEDKVLGRVESIQNADGIQDMTGRPWVWLNPIMGFAASFWITFVEKAQALKKHILGDRRMPILLGLNKGIFKIINRIYYYLGGKL
ncbi:MAG: signal peptidase I [Desulfobacteraceae bacterium]|nr:signal peptidase I [Desulfobacteraceae bacterium]MBC2757477.1 signal peptidase I [Desulfobacteraceae bacterium]